MSERNHELMNLFVVGMLTALGFASVYISRQSEVSTGSLSYAAFFFGLYLYRKSIRFRITTSNIETEKGILSKKIDVLELWRCRDVRYKQNLVDRVLGIAHVEIFTTDQTTPHLEVLGLPASRQLFEQIRDNIEIQRHAKNVYGVVS